MELRGTHVLLVAAVVLSWCSVHVHSAGSAINCETLKVEGSAVPEVLQQHPFSMTVDRTKVQQGGRIKGYHWTVVYTLR